MNKTSSVLHYLYRCFVVGKNNQCVPAHTLLKRKHDPKISFYYLNGEIQWMCLVRVHGIIDSFKAAFKLIPKGEGQSWKMAASVQMRSWNTW